MRSDRLDSLARIGIAFDLETWLIRPGNPAPPVVLGSYAIGDKSGLLSKDDAADLFLDITDSDYVLIGANIAFDVICMVMHYARKGADIMPNVLHMYEEGRVYDIQIAEQLHAIARGHLGYDPFTHHKMHGRYSLDACVQQRLGRSNAKANDRFRLSYALFDGMPLDQLPAEARTYPVDDAVNTRNVALAEAGLIPSVTPHVMIGINKYPWLACKHCGEGQSPHMVRECHATYRIENTHEIARQTYVHFCMALGAAWGFKVDQNAVDRLEAAHVAAHLGKQQPFIEVGIIRPDGTENQAVLKKLVARAYGAGSNCDACDGTGKVPSPKTDGRTKINCTACGGTGLQLPADVPRTEKAGIGKGRDSLYESGDEFLIEYARELEGQKIPKTYIPALRQTDKDGVVHKDIPWVLRPNPLVETGRTSYDGIVMLMPRTGGVRECIVARDGYVFSSEDFLAGELVTHGQSCIWITGASRLADALNKGLDAHLAGAATILGITYEEAVARNEAGDKQISNIRQAFKPCNFGFPGRMGAAKLVQQQRKGGPDTKALDGRTYKGLRFCILMGMADQCGIVKVTEWKGRPTTPTCKKCIECAEDLRKMWLLQWPENEAYFEYVKRAAENVERGIPISQHVTKRLRGFHPGQVDDDGNPINYGNAIANGWFQGLLADATKDAILVVTRRMFTPGDVLHGSRLIFAPHDELVSEHPTDKAAEAAEAVSFEMEASLKRYCPNMHPAVKAEPTLMRRLYKGAKPVRDENGRLVCWEPKQK